MIRTSILLLIAGLAPLAWGAGPKFPLTGAWEGSWGYTTGYEQFKVVHFQLVFAEVGTKLRGTYSSDDQKKPSKIEILEISDDRKSYRMNVAGDCWSVTIEGDEFSGVRNGGKCTKAGLGSGVRIDAISAKRTSRP